MFASAPLCADRESAPTGVLAEIPLAIASKRNSPALGPGFRSVAAGESGRWLPLLAGRRSEQKSAGPDRSGQMVQASWQRQPYSMFP